MDTKTCFTFQDTKLYNYESYGRLIKKYKHIHILHVFGLNIMYVKISFVLFGCEDLVS